MCRVRCGVTPFFLVHTPLRKPSIVQAVARDAPVANYRSNDRVMESAPLPPSPSAQPAAPADQDMTNTRPPARATPVPVPASRGSNRN
eukprot:scaffold128784_cov39-Tisochrysis_lutea.AAC.2